MRLLAFAATAAESSGFSVGSRRESREMRHGASVAQAHIDVRAARRRWIHQRSIADELHALLHGEHLRIVHAIEGMAGVERDGAVNDSATAIRYCRLTSGIALSLTIPAPSSGSRTTTRSTFAGVRCVIAAKRQQRIERRLNWIADGKRLDRCFGHVKPAPEIGRHFLGPRLGRMCLEPVVLAFEHVGHAGESGVRHHRSGHPIARPHAGKVERLFDVLADRAPSSRRRTPAAPRTTARSACRSRRGAPSTQPPPRRSSSSSRLRRCDACLARDSGRAPAASGSRCRSRAPPHESTPGRSRSRVRQQRARQALLSCRDAPSYRARSRRSRPRARTSR